MKNYKNAIPIALVFAMAISFYSLYTSNLKKENKYNNYLEQARYCAKYGIVDAVDNYTAALNMKNTLDVALEYGQYIESNTTEYTDTSNKAVIKWGEKLIKDFPKQAESYEYLLKYYFDNNLYSECFKLNDQIQHNHVSSDVITDIMGKIEYKYSESG